VEGEVPEEEDPGDGLRQRTRPALVAAHGEEAEANPEGSSRNLSNLDSDKRHVSMPSGDGESEVQGHADYAPGVSDELRELDPEVLALPH